MLGIMRWILLVLRRNRIVNFIIFNIIVVEIIVSEISEQTNLWIFDANACGVFHDISND